MKGYKVSWCFTINNPTEEDWAAVRDMKCQYICYAPEVGDEGTPHIQGFVHFENARSFISIRKRLPRAHIEAAKGSARQNRTYIFGPYDDEEGKHKDENPAAVERGDIPHQGKRSDLDAFVDAPFTNKRKTYTEHKDVVKRYKPFCDQWIRWKAEDQARDDYINGWRPKVDIFWSKSSGLGKTFMAYKHLAIPGEGELPCRAMYTNGKLWFENYDVGKLILIDEFQGQFPFSVLKELTDKYPFCMECKNGSHWRVKSDVIITSNKDPMDWYKDHGAIEMQQLCRRCNIHELVLNELTNMITDNLTGESWERRTE